MKKILTTSVLAFTALFFSFFLPKTILAATCTPQDSLATYGIHDQKTDSTVHVYGEIWLDPAKRLAFGYAIDTQAPDKQITIDIYNGPYCGDAGNILTEITAGGTDLSGVKPGHGFSYTLPSTLTSGSLYAYARNSDNITYQVLIWQDPTVLNFTLASAAPPVNPPTPTPLLKVSPPAATPHTLLNVSLQLPGIGQRGNLSPKHQIRPLHVTIYPANTDLTTNPTTPATFDSDKSPTKQSITFSSTTGFFANDSFDVGTLPTGDYEVFLKTPGYLRKGVLNTTDQTTTMHITGAATNLIPLTKLIAGDVATGDQGLSNVMESADFYQIVGCYKDKATTSTCINKDLADLNDDGTVDGIDLNYWLLGFQELQKNNNTQGNGDGAPGE